MLSIIVPVRNESENLREVFTYFSQNLSAMNYEVLIINDFSKDDTLEKTKKLMSEFKNFRVLDNKKRFRRCYKFRDTKSKRKIYINNDG